MKVKKIASRLFSSIFRKYKILFYQNLYHSTSKNFVYTTSGELSEGRPNKKTDLDYTIGIVAVAHKRFGELKVFVQSMINQTQNNWTLHVLHDGVNEEFCNIMEGYRREKPMQITYECTSERFNDYGHSLREIGLKKATGQYILITNADNYYAPKTLEFIDIAIKNSEHKPDVIMFDMVHSHRDPGIKKAPRYTLFKVSYKRNFIDMGSAVVETSLAQSAGFSDKSFAADATYFENILNKKLENGSRLILTKIPRVLLVHN